MGALIYGFTRLVSGQRSSGIGTTCCMGMVQFSVIERHLWPKASLKENYRPSGSTPITTELS
ncbi:hypothetical protein N792_09710 [Lysobacter concretionis Ko07 = DSM 16239]|uniref:Uncharacterized protein n=1 Tax=Lysobacter concretionis Ko07 = DSM 16239 TaxID=1122185 RepID=A0A0A0EMT9_9GAMM|nr:hypothetical protein N792_09710 [Lysobacter concretionis Ko07 = DSM 16239]